eukprot:GHVR01139444.1.p1 GENE.GHVR01139444.1~~GHVR01139444.1.p1  ORF type:complete len:157 (-),score=31.10 GHVR01139444.1:278-748(-)
MAFPKAFSIPQSQSGRIDFVYTPEGTGVCLHAPKIVFNKQFCEVPKVFVTLWAMPRGSTLNDERKMDESGVVFANTISHISTCGFYLNLKRLDPSPISSIESELKSMRDGHSRLIDMRVDWLAIEADDSEPCSYIAPSTSSESCSDLYNTQGGNCV